MPEPWIDEALIATTPPRAVSPSSRMATTVSFVTPDLKTSAVVGSLKL